MPNPKRLHYVCRANLNVKEREDGLFESGIWHVGHKSAHSAVEVYLHESRDLPSFRQGKVVDRWTEEYRPGQMRFIFLLEPLVTSMGWEGNGSGEKGYGY